MARFADAKITVPACFVAGDRDGVIAANRKLYEDMPNDVPDLRIPCSSADAQRPP